MRILLSAYGSRGDVEPIAALGARLRDLGADVRVCVPPDVTGPPLRAGLETVPVGPPVRPVLHGGTPLAVHLPRHGAELLAAQFGELAAAAAGCDAVVAAGMLHQLGVRSVAETLGVPYVYAAYSPVFLPSRHHPPAPLPGWPPPPGRPGNPALWRHNADGYDALFGPPLAAHRAAAGLPPVPRVRDHAFTRTPWLAADPVLAPWPGPPGGPVVQTGAWFPADGRPLPERLTAFLDAGPPPVFVGFGSVRAPDDVARVAVRAIRACGRRVLVGSGWAGIAPADDGDDCLAVGDVDQRALFARVAAVVHHGGAGTTTTAARAGAPQVVVPQDGDQPYWAARVAALGAGAVHDGPVPAVRSLSAALGVALSGPVRRRAAALAGAVRTDGAAVAATLLLGVLRRAGTRACT